MHPKYSGIFMLSILSAASLSKNKKDEGAGNIPETSLSQYTINILSPKKLVKGFLML